MAGFTPNYGLHQWEPTDPFLREDFNQDLFTIDTALGVVAAQSVQVPDLSYNVYNLMLQNDYDGKHTSYKKAMLFDGFLDERCVAEKSAEIFYNGKNAMLLHRTGQKDQDFGYTGNDTEPTLTRRYTAVSGGKWTGMTYRIYNNTNYSDKAQVTYTVKVDGKTVASGVEMSPTCPVGSYCDKEITFSEGFPVCVGTVCEATIQTTSRFYAPARGTDGSGLGCFFYFTPVTAATGQILTVSYALPACDGMRVWVRYQGGSVAIARAEDGNDRALEQVDLRQTVNIQGQNCREAEFRLDQPLDEGWTAFRLTLNTEEADYMILYDYGAVLL